VQIIEFVTGNPRTLKTAGAADGTFSSAGLAACAGALEFAALEATAALPAFVCEDGCASTFASKIAAKNAHTKNIFPNGFTVKKSLQTTRIAWHFSMLSCFRESGVCLIVKKFTSTF